MSLLMGERLDLACDYEQDIHKIRAEDLLIRETVQANDSSLG
jgi:hypothetical protein